MKPFMVEYTDGSQYIVLDRENGWNLVANATTKEIASVKSLKSYKFIGFVK